MKKKSKYAEYREYKTFIEAYHELGHQEVLRRLNSYSKYRIRARRDTKNYKLKKFNHKICPLNYNIIE